MKVTLACALSPNFLHAANAGLYVARELMKKIKQEFPWISYGDLWTPGNGWSQDPLMIKHNDAIKWCPGRIDGFTAQATPDGHLLDASQRADHLGNVLYRMGFDDQKNFAFSGAYALDRCHSNRSGFEDPWTFSPTNVTNDYFQHLFSEKCVWKN